MSERSDQNLLEQYAQTRSDADFRPLVLRYAPLVYGACLRRLIRHDLAEDATQAVFILLAEKAGRIRVGATLAPWLFSASKYVSARIARTERRRQKREIPLTETVPARETINDADAVAALERLRGGERDAVVLSVLHGLSLAEVGAQLGVSEDAARMRVKRGLVRLRERLEPLGTLAPSLIDRFASPSRSSTDMRHLALQGYHVMNTSYLLAVPGGLVIAAFAFHHGRAIPSSPTADPAPLAPRPAKPATKTQKVAGAKNSQFHFEEYLGKTQAWFKTQFGPPDTSSGSGGIGGGQKFNPDGSLVWELGPRRRDLGGNGTGKSGQAGYFVGDPNVRKGVSVCFDSPADAEPVATIIQHGSEYGVHRSLDEEAAYVGISLQNYTETRYDAESYPKGTRFFLKKTGPPVEAIATNLNDTFQIQLRVFRPPTFVPQPRP